MVFYVVTRLDKPHGLMEQWNVGILGMETGKGSILQKILNLIF